jgi:hypothetical protein
MIKTLLLLFVSLVLSLSGLHCQQHTDLTKARLPVLGIKTNLLSDMTTTMNLAGEFRLSDYLTLDLSVGYNPWTFSGNKKFKHISVQPELRYWIYEPFNGHYLGARLIYSDYNTGGLNLPLDILPLRDLKDYRYRGNAYGAGLSYGYQWILSRRWNLEATLGLGYMYLDYTRYECKACGKRLDEGYKHYFGPTGAGVSLIYIIK